MEREEIERSISERERKFDLARNRVEQLEIALRGHEDSLDSSISPLDFQGRRLQAAIRRAEADLVAAKAELVTAREKLEEAWALRSPASAEIQNESQGAD